MRATFLLSLLPVLAGCGLPQLDVAQDARTARGDYLVLVPSGDITERVASMPDVDPDIAADLESRTTGLRDRAEAIEAPERDTTAEERAARLRERARGMR